MERIGQFELMGVLGDGGMGTVYKARDPRFGRLVAIKVLHPQFRRDPAVVERFKTEAVIQAKLNHRNIVTVYDFLAEGEILAMVMEFVDGRSLDQVVKDEGPLPAARAKRIFAQVLKAMNHAHMSGLVHRDIKPSNIVLQGSVDDDVAKVMDFGIAKILGSDKQKTKTGAKMGTLAYMSPEQIQNPKEVDSHSDIYSLGATFYEVLSGDLPFDGETELEIMHQILDRPPHSLLLRHAHLPEQLDLAIRKALAKRPDERFADCQEFLAALDGAPVTLPPPPPANSYAASSRTQMAVSTAETSSHRMLKRDRRQPNSSARNFAVAGVVVLAVLAAALGVAYYHRGQEQARAAIVQAQHDRDVAAQEADQRLRAERELRERLEAETRQQAAAAEQASRQAASRRAAAEEEAQQRASRARAARMALGDAVARARSEVSEEQLSEAKALLLDAKKAVPLDLLTEVRDDYQALNDELDFVDQALLKEEAKKTAAELVQKQRESDLNARLALARQNFDSGKFPEAKSICEDLLRQQDLPQALARDATALRDQAGSELKKIFERTKLGKSIQTKKKG